MTATTPWRGSIGCEGGPVVVMNLADFLHWRGAEPLPDSERQELHLWSPFTPELPERFRPDGPTGHQYLPAAGPEALAAMRDELFGFVRERWPGTVVTQEFETWIARRPDGARLHVAFEPTSEYDRATRDLDEVQLHRFDTARDSIVWSVEPGTVEVVRQAPGELLLVQIRYAEDAEPRDSAIERAAAEAAGRNQAGELTLVLEPGPVVVAWAPNSALDGQAEILANPPSAAEPGILLDLATGGSGALLSLPPGSYAATIGDWADDRSGAAWCAFLRG